MADSGGWRIEGVAAAAGLSTRNVRAYQSLGLVPGPRLDGRVGRYDETHLDRLRAIGRLQARGFSLSGIKALFDAFERGDTLGRLLGVSPPAVADPAAARPTRSLQLALVPGPLAPPLEAPTSN
jgi:DNA-binding transcriptional MerR regulator